LDNPDCLEYYKKPILPAPLIILSHIYRLVRRNPQVDDTKASDTKSTKTYFNKGHSSLVALEKWGTDSYFNDIRVDEVKAVPKILDAVQKQIDDNNVSFLK